MPIDCRDQPCRRTPGVVQDINCSTRAEARAPLLVEHVGVGVGIAAEAVVARALGLVERYDTDTQQFTVVPWDHNLAFGDAGFGMGGGQGGPGGRGGFPPGGELPEGFEPADGFEPGDLPDGFEPPEGFEPGELPEGFEPGQRPGGFGGEGGPGGPGERSNILVQRLRAIDEFSSLYEERLAELTTTLVDSGIAADLVATWAAALEEGASDLVSVDTITTEAQRLTDAL